MEIWGLFLYLHACKSARVAVQRDSLCWSQHKNAECPQKRSLPNRQLHFQLTKPSWIQATSAQTSAQLLRLFRGLQHCPTSSSFRASRAAPSLPLRMHKCIQIASEHQAPAKSCLCLGQGGWKPVRTKRRLHLCQFSGIIEVQRRGICWTPLSF